MRYDDRAGLGPSPTGGGPPPPSAGVALGGGAGAIVVIVIALLFGVDPGQVLRGGPGSGPGPASSSPVTPCTWGADTARDRSCRLDAVTRSIQDYWGGAQAGYQGIDATTFEGSVMTGCGGATSEVGPFYCPADTTVYLDLGFFDELTTRSRARGGDAAEAYVLAHEFGHHVQDLAGAMERVRSAGRGTGPTSPGVRLELQADCYAGVWFHHATDDPDDPVSGVGRDDLDRAVDAVAAVGDARVRQQTRGQLTPESWTHASTAQRQRWLRRGFDTGDPARCDTFGRDALR